MGRVRGFPITFGTLKFQIDFLMVKDAPLGMIIGLPELTRMKTLVNLVNMHIGNIFHVKLVQGKNNLRIPIGPERVSPLLEEPESERNLFTTDTSPDHYTSSMDNESEDDYDQELFVALVGEGPEEVHDRSPESEEEDEELHCATFLSRNLSNLDPVFK